MQREERLLVLPMDSNKCACLALIIGRAANQNYQSVYDFGAGKLCMFTSSGSVGNIHVFDFQRDSFVTGSLANLFKLYRVQPKITCM